MASTQLDILNAVKTVIANLSLTDCEEVAVRAVPKDGGTFYHGITVSPTGEHELSGTNERDDFAYQVLITCVVNNDIDPTERDLFGTWRQRIRKAFLHQKLSGVAERHYLSNRSGTIVREDPRTFGY